MARRQTATQQNEATTDMGTTTTDPDEVIIDTEVDNDVIIDDSGVEEIDDEYGEFDGGELTTTANFTGSPEVVDEIVELPLVIADEKTKTFEVRVVDDVGPVYYGQRLIELKKGRRYRVDHAIYDYLRVRNLLVG